MYQRVKQGLDWLIQRLAIVLGAASIAIMMFAGTFDAFGRSLFNRPLWGASEIVEFCMALTTFLSIPAISRARSHVVIDLLDNMLRPIHRLQLILGDLLGAGIFSIMAWRIWIQGERAADYGDLTQVFQLPVSLIYKTLAILAALAVISFVLNTIDDVRGTPPGGAKSDDHSAASGVGL
ncbi:MAG TPA: TRAP transporter small permease [Tianweitania sediminis]|jgi:TRAP-type C4-dicarboxylate transport system permease small subunit|nr:TRAP transporter small permease [Tianweitania sediminis]